MTWSLEPKEVIGIEIPFDRPLSADVTMDTTVVFPDAGGVTSGFPALYYVLFGEGVVTTPQLVNQNASLGGTMMFTMGTTKVRFYLEYNAKIGPTGSIAKGVFTRSAVTLQPHDALALPMFGVRVFDLVLRTNATRVTVPENTTMGYPVMISDTAEMTPQAEAVIYKRSYNEFGVDMVHFWIELNLVEPPEHEIGLLKQPYAHPLSGGMNANSIAVNNALGQTNISANTGAIATYAVRADNSLTDPLPARPGAEVVSGISNGQFMPAGSKTVLMRFKTTKANYDTRYAPGVAIGGKAHFYFRLDFLKPIYTPGTEGVNLRLPYYVYVHAVHSGEDYTTRPWWDKVPPLV